MSLRERQRTERQQLTREHQAERAAGRTVCLTGKERAKEEGLELKRVAEQEYKEERTFQHQIQRAGKPARERSTGRERGQEDDDAVRNNLPLCRARHNGNYAESLIMFSPSARGPRGASRRAVPAAPASLRSA